MRAGPGSGGRDRRAQWPPPGTIKTIDYETAAIGTPSVSVYIWGFSGASSLNTAYPITWQSAAVEYLP